MSVWKTVILAAGIALAVPSCGGGSTGGNVGGGCTSPIGGASGVTAAQTVKVVTDPNTVGRFDPKSVSIKAGDSITWDFQDQSVSHTVTADNGSFDSCLQAAGFTFTVTLSTAGTYSYKCTVHAGMIGEIKVS